MAIRFGGPDRMTPVTSGVEKRFRNWNASGHLPIVALLAFLVLVLVLAWRFHAQSSPVTASPRRLQARP